MDALHFTKIILALNEAKSRVSDMQASLTNFIKMHEVLHLVAMQSSAPALRGLQWGMQQTCAFRCKSSLRH